MTFYLFGAIVAIVGILWSFILALKASDNDNFKVMALNWVFIVLNAFFLASDLNTILKG